jgi:hypothetical protein
LNLRQNDQLPEAAALALALALKTDVGWPFFGSWWTAVSGCKVFSMFLQGSKHAYLKCPSLHHYFIRSKTVS